MQLQFHMNPRRHRLFYFSKQHSCNDLAVTGEQFPVVGIDDNAACQRRHLSLRLLQSAGRSHGRLNCQHTVLKFMLSCPHLGNQLLHNGHILFNHMDSLLLLQPAPMEKQQDAVKQKDRQHQYRKKP